eukprot:284819045_4
MVRIMSTDHTSPTLRNTARRPTKSAPSAKCIVKVVNGPWIAQAILGISAWTTTLPPKVFPVHTASLCTASLALRIMSRHARVVSHLVLPRFFPLMSEVFPRDCPKNRPTQGETDLHAQIEKSHKFLTRHLDVFLCRLFHVTQNHLTNYLMILALKMARWVSRKTMSPPTKHSHGTWSRYCTWENLGIDLRNFCECRPENQKGSTPYKNQSASGTPSEKDPGGTRHNDKANLQHVRERRGLPTDAGEHKHHQGCFLFPYCGDDKDGGGHGPCCKGAREVPTLP